MHRVTTLKLATA